MMSKMPMPNKEKPKKKTEIPKASFIKLPNNEIAESIWNAEKKEGKFLKYNIDTMKIEESYDINGIKPYNNEMIEKAVVLLPSMNEEYGDEKELLEDIRQFIHKYVDVSEFFEKLTSYYVMFSWAYDNFNTLPYLRVLGDYGSGKTRFLLTVGSVCYKPMFAGGATTPSPVFRIIDMFHGTLVLDEADFKASEEWSEIIKILNCGFQEGFPVLRTEEKDGQREPRAYDCYSPKILATRKEFKDKALESRCLTERIVETGRMDIPLILGPEFKEEALLIRNKLLTFRFRHYGKHKIDHTLQDRTIEKRLNQVIIPLFSIAKDDDIRQEIMGFVKEYNKKLIADRGEQFEALVLEKMFEILQNRIDNETLHENLYLKQISDKVNSDLPPDRPITPHRVSGMMRKMLFLELVKDRSGRYVRWNVPIFFKLIKKYGVCDDVTFATFLRDTSSNVTQTKDTTIRDVLSVHPVGASQPSHRHSKDNENVL